MDLNKVLSLSSYARTVGSMFLSPDNTGIANAPYINFGMTQTLVDNTVLSIGIIDTILDNLKRHNCSESEEEAIYDMLEDVGDNLRVGLMDFMDKLIADSMCANYQTLLGINDNSDDGVDFEDEDDSFACPHCGRCYDEESDDIEDELEEDFSLEDDDIVSCPVCGSLLDEEGHKDTFDELIDVLKDKE